MSSSSVFRQSPPLLRPHVLRQQALCTRLSINRRTYHSSPTSHRGADETSIASAKHKPSLSGPSLGHLLTELSATTPDMLKEGLREEGHTLNEEHRTLARKVAIGIVGLPLAFGSIIVGIVWLWRSEKER